MSLSPPRWARWLVETTCPRREREFLLGDLEEELRHLARTKGERAARAWYRRQALRSALPNLRNPRLRGPRTTRGDGVMSTLVADLREGHHGALAR